MNQESKEILEMLNECEVQSLNYEGCVGIRKNKVYRDGELIDTLNTDEKVSEIWEEYKIGEGF